MLYIERIRKIKRAAQLRFGPFSGADNSKVTFAKSTYVSCKSDKPAPYWRLDVWENGIDTHGIFNLETDYTNEAIEHKFEAMEVAREEYLKSTPETEEKT